jgi:hypothetical protein
VSELEPEQRADALDRPEVVVVSDRPHRAAVSKGLMNRKVEA